MHPLARIGWSLAGLTWLACASLEGAEELSAGELHRLQRETLAFVIRDGAPLPPAPTAAERDAVHGVLSAATPQEAEELRSFYGDEVDLLVYATRDSDGDGVHDFRVSDYHGKFLEGDVDLDGDGVRNALDASPYDASRGGDLRDENRNGVPDPVDWALGGARPEAARYQRELFVDHGLLLVDRSASFDELLARAVHDVMTRVLRAVPRDRLRALRVVAAEEECLLVPEEESETNAMMMSQTQTLVVYRSGIDLAPLAQLGLLLHELAHGYQFSLDFEELEVEARKVHFPAPHFLARVARFGWTFEPLPEEDRLEAFALFTPHYLMDEPYYAWRGESPEWWAEWLEELYLEAGDAYLRDAHVVERGIVGDYSLENPWEWHSDSLLAYLFVEIERWLARLPDAVPARTEAMELAAEEAWPSFRYGNLGADVRRHFRAALPLPDDDLAYFAAAYVDPLVEGD